MKYGQVETKKLYFSSSEAAEKIGVPVNVLHSWEKEFPALKPQKNKTGKRIYRQSDIDIAKEIKENANTNTLNEGQKAKREKSVAKKQKTSDKELLLTIRNKLQNVLTNISKR